MNVRIQKMTLENFKGIKNLEIRFDAHDAVIYGDNATGKTTLFDAFLWLLFGKDSSDRSDFGVKPYAGNGQEIHNLETVVEAELEIDGLKIATLKHMLKENWVKKNGQSEQVFSGNQHKYWINGISHSGWHCSEEDLSPHHEPHGIQCPEMAGSPGCASEALSG